MADYDLQWATYCLTSDDVDFLYWMNMAFILLFDFGPATEEMTACHAMECGGPHCQEIRLTQEEGFWNFDDFCVVYDENKTCADGFTCMKLWWSSVPLCIDNKSLEEEKHTSYSKGLIDEIKGHPCMFCKEDDCTISDDIPPIVSCGDMTWRDNQSPIETWSTFEQEMTDGDTEAVEQESEIEGTVEIEQELSDEIDSVEEKKDDSCNSGMNGNIVAFIMLALALARLQRVGAMV